MKIVSRVTQLTKTLHPFNLSEVEESKAFDEDDLFCSHLETTGYTKILLEIREQSEEFQNELTKNQQLIIDAKEIEKSSIIASKDQSTCCINDAHGIQGLIKYVEDISEESGIRSLVEQYVCWINDTHENSSSSESRAKDISNTKLIHDKLSGSGKQKEHEQSFISKEVYIGDQPILEVL